jgi:hypothetical protein
MLRGYADLKVAIKVVNKSQLFRIRTKLYEGAFLEQCPEDGLR